MKKQGWYQTSEFAELTGVTVRTLHHYDRLGLLKPVGRTAAGYRLYSEGDLARLEQILTLKFIGFSLGQIKEILHRDKTDLPTILRQQREIIEQKRQHLNLAIQAIRKAEQALATSLEPDWEDFKKIIEVINMENNMEWVQKYYSDEAQAELEKRRREWTPELQAKAEQDWKTLIQEVETAIANGEDPAGDTAQKLAKRWTELIEQFTKGNPAVREGLNQLYADQQNWPATFKKPYSDEVGAFICQAAALGNKDA